MRALALLAALLALVASACAAGPRAPLAREGPPPPAEPGEVLAAFSAALEAGRFELAYALLSARWRARETPARLASDLEASGAVGPDAIRRVRALLAAGARPVVRGGEEAVLAVGEGEAARLVREGGAWRVDALE
ncbi:MAG TPA: hypothetical protein VMG32_09820 [Anaeromyxobacteraceae bacterium]|nr:hypothetical protein [Anaeromyxobacteraceae bacterium]